METIFLQVMMICFLLFWAMNANCLFITTTPSYATDNGVKPEEIANIMAVTGVIEIVCRIAHGWIADRKVMPAITQLALVLFLSGIAAFIAAIIPGVIGMEPLCFTL